MKPYLILQLTTLALVVIGIGMFYSDLASGNFNFLVVIYFVIIAIAYVVVINKLNRWARMIFENVAKKLNCKFIETGKYALTHYIKCPDMEIKINLRGSYTPASLYFKFSGNFNQADIRGSDENSLKFISYLQKLQEKYRIKVNDAYISKNVAEMIITKFSYNADILAKMIEDAKAIISKV